MTFNSLQNAYELKGSFFASLRDKVSYWCPYTICSEHLRAGEIFLYTGNLTELKECKQSWGNSSASLEPVYKDQAIPLIQLHADRTWFMAVRYQVIILKEISDLTGVPVSELVLELIRSLCSAGIILSRVPYGLLLPHLFVRKQTMGKANSLSNVYLTVTLPNLLKMLSMACG